MSHWIVRKPYPSNKFRLHVERLEDRRVLSAVHATHAPIEVQPHAEGDGLESAVVQSKDGQGQNEQDQADEQSASVQAHGRSEQKDSQTGDPSGNQDESDAAAARAARRDGEAHENQQQGKNGDSDGENPKNGHAQGSVQSHSASGKSAQQAHSFAATTSQPAPVAAAHAAEPQAHLFGAAISQSTPSTEVQASGSSSVVSGATGAVEEAAGTGHASAETSALAQATGETRTGESTAAATLASSAVGTTVSAAGLNTGPVGPIASASVRAARALGSAGLSANALSPHGLTAVGAGEQHPSAPAATVSARPTAAPAATAGDQPLDISTGFELHGDTAPSPLPAATVVAGSPSTAPPLGVLGFEMWPAPLAWMNAGAPGRAALGGDQSDEAIAGGGLRLAAGGKAVWEPEGVLPPGAGLLAGDAPVDTAALQRGLEAFFAQLDAVGRDLTRFFTDSAWAPWVAAFALSAAALEVRRRRRDRQACLATEADGPTPSLGSGSWPLGAEED